MFSNQTLLIYSNQDDNAERYKAKRYYLPKCIIKNYNVIINGNNFYDQLIDSDITRFEEIKNHYRLMAVDMSRQKELYADPKAIQQIEFVGQLKVLMVKMLMVHNPCLF